jgi:CubicO group peptidase (beta-lactamase class C family)
MRKLAWVLLLCVAPVASAQSKNASASRLDALFADFTGHNVPGAGVLVIQDNKVVYEKSFGMANLQQKRRATSKTNYRLASVSKQFTAMAILILAQRKKLSLDGRLTDYFPDFPAYGREIRVRHLLNHTSGLPAYEEHMPPGEEPVVDADVLEILKKVEKPYFAAGTQFRYSNSGYALLALIVEKVSGQPFPEFLRANIFKPVGMNGTVMNVRAAPPGEDRRAYGYSKRDGAWERTDQSRTSYVLGDGGIYSSGHDLRKWVRALDEARLVRRETWNEAMSASTAARPLGEDRSATSSADEDVGYGFGWFVSRYRGTNAVWHGGSTLGFRNHLLHIPERKLTVIVLTNRDNADPAALARRIVDVFLAP